MPTSQKPQDSQQALGELVEDSSIEPISTETSKSVTTTTASRKRDLVFGNHTKKRLKNLLNLHPHLLLLQVIAKKFQQW